MAAWFWCKSEARPESSRSRRLEIEAITAVRAWAVGRGPVVAGLGEVLEGMVGVRGVGGMDAPGGLACEARAGWDG